MRDGIHEGDTKLMWIMYLSFGDVFFRRLKRQLTIETEAGGTVFIIPACVEYETAAIGL